MTKVRECRACAVAQRVATYHAQNEDFESLAEDMKSITEAMDSLTEDVGPDARDTHSVAEDIAYIAEDIEEEAVVISGRTLKGLVVLPREHIASLEDLSVKSRAHVLATIRRASLSVQQRTPESEIRIAVTSDSPASVGHACFYIAPSNSEHPENTTSKTG